MDNQNPPAIDVKACLGDAQINGCDGLADCYWQAGEVRVSEKDMTSVRPDGLETSSRRPKSTTPRRSSARAVRRDRHRPTPSLVRRMCDLRIAGAQQGEGVVFYLVTDSGMHLPPSNLLVIEIIQ